MNRRKKIYEIAVKGAYEYEKEYPGTRLMCVVDCRNRQSLEALAFAVENINNNSKVGEGNFLPANIMAYYELKSKENKDFDLSDKLRQELIEKGIM